VPVELVAGTRTQDIGGIVEPIWSDKDVADIIGYNPDGSVVLRLGRLNPTSLQMMLSFIETDQAVDQDKSLPAFIRACAIGVHTFESLPQSMEGTNALGWRKFVLNQTGVNAGLMWDHHQTAAARETTIFSDWTMEALTSVGAKPDGWTSALGYLFSNRLATALQARPGLYQNPVTGEYEVAGGNAARAFVEKYLHQ
jgi:hypothetical protein